MPKARGIVALVATAAILAACESTGGVISYVDVETTYVPGNVGYATHDGKLAAVVHGSPFGRADAGTAEAIARGLELPGWFPPATLTTVPTGVGGDRAAFRVVLVFNPDTPHLGGKGACGDLSAVPLRAPGPAMRVAMAFCNDAKPEAELMLVHARPHPLDTPETADSRRPHRPDCPWHAARPVYRYVPQAARADR